MKLRLLVANSRGLAAAAVAALGLGIGITALMFAIVDGAVRRGLPVPEPGNVVHLDRVPAPGEQGRVSLTAGDRAALEASGALSALAAYRPALMNLTAGGITPRRWDTALVSPGTFAVLGVSAAQGRVFDRAASQAGGVTPLVISDDVWRAQFGGDAAAVGRAVTVNGLPAVITGVMPPGFRFPFNQHVWMPLDERAAAAPVMFWGRLAAGVSEREAAARLTAAYQQDAGTRGADAAGAAARVSVAPFTAHILQPQAVQLLEMMFMAGLGVLAIACANVANLLLARGLARRRDFAIAGALGATRARIMRERVIEGLALAAPGALLGVALAYAGAAAFTRAIADSVPPPPYWVSVAVDLRVAAFAAAVAVISALVASALPSWRSGTVSLAPVLADEARGTTSRTLRRTTAALVIVEIALATGVLIAAGLMTKGLARLNDTNFAFAVDDVTTGRVSLPPRLYADAGRRQTFYRALHDGLQRGGGMQAALGSSMPFAFVEMVPFWLHEPDRADAERIDARRMVVSPGYFATLGTRLIGGRDFEAADDQQRAPVAIVNLSFALRYARREDLIGRTIRIGAASAPPATIIGIAPDLAVGNARGEQPEAVYVPLFQQAAPPEGITVLARGPVADGAIERRLRDTLTAVDPELPLDRVMTLAAFRKGATWFYRVFGVLFVAFGAGALALALVGVYAVMSFGVTRRRREIGTRMAFGATRRDIARLFLVEGARRLVAGLAAGALLAAWLTPKLALFLFQVSPRDPAVFAAAIAIVAAVGLSACALPALRAARQDPNACLRDSQA